MWIEKIKVSPTRVAQAVEPTLSDDAASELRAVLDELRSQPDDARAVFAEAQASQYLAMADNMQAQIDALPHPVVIEQPKGAATIETYTVVHGREGYMMGIVVGRDSEGRRFIANTPTDEATLRGLEASEAVGRTGTVGRSEDGARNIFVPD